MIANITRSSNFHSIARYIFGKPDAEALLENVPEGETIDEKAASMEWVAARNKRVKKPAYHLSISPAKGDELSRSEWSMFCGEFLDELGLSQNQVLIGLHHDVRYPNSDKTRTHAHLLINLVDDLGERADMSWDYLKVPKVLRHLERSYGLQSVPDVGESEKQQDTPGYFRFEQRLDTDKPTDIPTHRSSRVKLQNIIDEAIADSNSFQELSAAMKSTGVEVNVTERGWWMRYEGIPFAGYQLGRKYTMPAVLKRLEKEQMADFENEEFDESTASMRDVFQIQQPEVQADTLELESQPKQQQKESEAENPELEATQESEASTVGQDLGELVVAPGNLIEMMKQTADRLEQSDYIDGRFYAGMFLDVTAHLAEIVEVGRESLESQETATQEEPQSSIPQNENDDDWLEDKEALQDFDERLAKTPEGEGDEKLPDEVLQDFDQRLASSVLEKSQAVAESLSQFVHVRSAVHDLNIDDPIETNLGTLHFSSDNNTISITKNIPLAHWDEELQEWQIEEEVADSHKENVERLLNNQALDTKGYQFSDEIITFEQIQFRGELTDEGWQVSNNSLSLEEQKRIVQLPQSEEEYVRNIDGKDLLDYFQRHASEQFKGDVGSIHWKSESESFDRIFEITKQSDRSFFVEGFDLTQTDDLGNPRKIFSASMEGKDSIQCKHNEIPTSDIDDLLAQESRNRENKPQMDR